MLGRLLDLYLDRVAPASAYERRRQAAVLMMFLALLVGQCIIWTVGHASTGTYLLAALFGGAGVLAGLLAYSPAWGFSIQRAGHFGLAVALTMLCLSTYFTGGLRMTNVTPFLSVVIAAIFVLGRTGLTWALVAFAAALAFQIGEWAGVTFPDLVAPEDRAADAFLTWLFAGLLILLYAYLYERMRAVAAHQAEVANAARDQFLASLSHEIRTPLHVMLAFQAELEHTEPERQAKLLAVLRANTAQLNELLTDLLDLARGESSGFVLETGDFDPVAVLENVSHTIEPLARDKGLALHVAVADDVPRWTRGDARRVHQILMNLADNAVKYTEHGSVTLEIRRVGEAVCYRIADTGVGIPRDGQARIFEKFTRLEPSLGSRNRGVGLGLSIARGLVDAMGGTITLESEPGTGTTFTVELPLSPATTTPMDRPSHDAPAVHANGARVLVVEDNELNRDVARHMLERMGVDTLCAHDGRSAIELWQVERPALILMDVQMPGMDGLRATHEIRRLEGGSRRTRIVATTGYATSSSSRELTEAGVDDVLVKPFSYEQLAKMVAMQLNEA